MEKDINKPANEKGTKKGYNEKNPGQPEGAFPPASEKQPQKKDDLKSNTADKKAKEDQD